MPGGQGPVPPADAAPHGYLRLTDAGHDRSAATLFEQPLPATEGLVVTFDQWQYGGSPYSPSEARHVLNTAVAVANGGETRSAPARARIRVRPQLPATGATLLEPTAAGAGVLVLTGGPLATLTRRRRSRGAEG
ncbi:MAG: hypothetical protein ACJ786_27530 [Catenulispora sp.]